jgi:hypothetical protein
MSQQIKTEYRSVLWGSFVGLGEKIASHKTLEEAIARVQSFGKPTRQDANNGLVDFYTTEGNELVATVRCYLVSEENKIQKKKFPYSTSPLPDGVVIGGFWPNVIISWPNGNSRGATKPEYDLFQALESALEKIKIIRNEVNCRIEHGAHSGGHLEYVQKKLDEML